MTKLSLKDRITKARISLVLENPFFGSLALRLLIRENRNIQTGRTNGKVIEYNPAWLEPMTTAKIKGFFAHEVMHLACKHHLRMKSRDHRKWNFAGDSVIDLILQANGFDLPDLSHINACYDNMSAEAVYSALPSYNEPDNQKGQGQWTGKGHCQGDPDDDQDHQDQDHQEDQDDQDDQYQDRDDQEPENPYEQHMGNGDVFEPDNEDGSKMTQADQMAEENRWDIAVSQAAAHAKGVGKLPAGLESFADSLKEKKVHWRHVLREFVENTCKDDYSFLHPNRRYLQSGFYLPSLHSDKLGKIVACLDTSGSITQDDVEHFATELTSILEDFNLELDVYQVDHKLQGECDTFSQNDLPVKLKLRGGGGTDFRPVFEHLDEIGEQPKALIYFTDMYCDDYPESYPDYGVLWLDTKQVPDFPYGEPPYGTVYAVNQKVY